MSKIVEVYTDGGVIGSNPSPDGGTWAYCWVNEAGERVKEGSGRIVPHSELCPFPTTTNNLAEYTAVVMALEDLPDGWEGDLCTDSQVVKLSICRTVNPKSWLPEATTCRMRQHKARLRFRVRHLQGHPTQADLACGHGAKRGLPVSVHNVHCDWLCGQRARDYYQSK